MRSEFRAQISDERRETAALVTSAESLQCYNSARLQSAVHMSDPLRTDTLTRAAMPRRTRIATRRSSSSCSSASITTSPPSTSRRSTSGRARCSSIAATPRARAYIERARSALAERQRESEELLQNGVAAFQRGEGDEARRLLQAAIDGGAPSDEALAVLDRLNRLESGAPPPSPTPVASRRAKRRAAAAPPAARGRSSASR